MTGSSTINERKKRWLKLLSGELANRCMFLIEVEDSIKPRPLLWREKKRERIEWISEKYSKQMEMLEWLDDDRIPFLDMLTGTEIFAECFGCQVYLSHDNMPFALPLINSAGDVARLKQPKLEDTPLMYLFEMADELSIFAGKQAVFKLPDIQSPMDVAALIWNKNDFYISLIDEPEAVKTLAGMVKTLMLEFLDEWFIRYGREFIAHFPDYYMQQGLSVSVDEIGVISKEMFKEFFLPELVDLSNHYGGLGIHCCANARHHWESFKMIPNLQVLNLCQPENILAEAYGYFGGRFVQMHSWYEKRPVWEKVSGFPKDSRVVLQLLAENRDEALRVCEKCKIACGRQ
ncbi:MAG: hypothetical protein HPY74_09780 [Firmicutes bacterium]|nr:hypothetical protein [Bacillota bacterium]